MAKLALWVRCSILASTVVLLLAGAASANTLTQNSAWTIDRSDTSVKYRVVAYGDSIFAGYNGSITSVDIWAAPTVQGDYLKSKWRTDVEVIRRAKSGAVASDIYNNKIVAERSYMQTSNTRVVTFEMCGNDYLQARSSFSGQTGTCNYGPLDTALANCTYYTQLAMQAINAYATYAKTKMVVNLYYPGYNADNTLTSCTDSSTGTRVNKQSKFLPYLAKSNWRVCYYAAQYGFQCVDSFAEYMGADYDSNGDGKIDTDGLRYIPGESEAAYVTRITSTLRGTIRDSNYHLASASTSYDYLLSDNTHPTYSGGTQLSGIFGSSSGSSAGFADSQIVGGKNPIWNVYGHEKMGWASSVLSATSP